MKKQILITTASFLLLSGCGGKDKEIAAPVTTAPATPSTATAPILPAAPQPQSSEVKSQEIAVAPDLATGERAYKGTCSICHTSGLGGAPRMDNKKDWELRIAQGSEVLYDHAINGYRGSKGFMPPRGSSIKLSENETKAAVDYMVAHTMQAEH